MFVTQEKYRVFRNLVIQYNPHYHTDDKELSLLVLKLGGPTLLEILYRAGDFTQSWRFYTELKILYRAGDFTQSWRFYTELKLFLQ